METTILGLPRCFSTFVCFEGSLGWTFSLDPKPLALAEKGQQCLHRGYVHIDFNLGSNF